MAFETVEEEYTIPEQVKYRERVVARICDGCGARDEPKRDYFNPTWIPITVEAGETGEEGWNELERIYCDDCAINVLTELGKLGFQDHYHGSTNLLENIDCIGSGYKEPFGDCPTPSSGPYGDEDE